MDCIKVGVYKNDDGEFFGTYKNGMKEGKGEFRWWDGASFMGYFENDFPKIGTKMSSDGNSYEGEFCSNEFCGQGTYHWKSGKTYRGDF